ncbi:Kinesin [Macleaya cordata]|uniref:Kinesin-like protein n=1 Tax=Macleaya cordata TaxID=56857 RepID=A0A200QRD1_MACCD|nr:Kinesin [Macleaya cordata]
MVRTPLTPASMVRTPLTPASKVGRTPAPSTPGGPKAREEKIFVTVRVRPLSRKEQALNDQIAWDCTDEHTILSRNLNNERSTVPYIFDRVFDPTCLTQKVYEEGAKDVALSPLTGINATIFAYGQTSSGKTFTMRGITENAVKDIYEHIRNTPERDFVLKISALEIYNETVVDLLNRDSGPLRLLDDPEKGTFVEKLVEEVAKDSNHLRSLIGICEAQRQVGETALNDTSSRSHQIMRLTVESCLRENSGCVKSFVASLNLVDLAGSERASQTNVDGVRLKEGSHINRSLLTLTTVIRKLSGGRRSCHIPYRDSKLTRILQPSLGGNSRTAIICTMSPALSHMEQSRNTLSFASRAKEVTNSAQVNMVVAEKQLLKHLQKEVARLEAELQSPEPSSSSCLKSLLVERDLKIQQMMLEMEELKRERDIAQSELELERKMHKKQKGSSRQIVKRLPFSTENEPVSAKPSSLSGTRNKMRRNTMMRQSTDPSMLVSEIRKLEQRQRQLGEEANRALEVLHKEVSSHRLGSQDAAETIAKLLSEIKEMRVVSSIAEDIEVREKTSLKEEISRLNSDGITIATLEKQLENAQKSIDKLMLSLPSNDGTTESKLQTMRKKTTPFPLRNTTNRSHIIRSPCSPLSSSRKVRESEQENQSPQNEDLVPGADTLLEPCKSTPRREDCNGISSREGTPGQRRPNSVNVKKMQEMFKNAAEENIRSIRAYVTELKERVAKLQYQKQLLVCQVLELEENEASASETGLSVQSPMSWNLVFDDQRRQIIMLWHLCHVSIVHRTQFYLLFRGHPDDQMYMEVELRRLTWLEQKLAEVGNASPALLGDEPAGSVSSSIRALKQEREHLAKRVTSKLTSQELEMLYIKWEVPPGGKQRRLQLVNKLWTDPHNMEHVKESAEVVAKLVGFCESGEQISKEMFELNFVLPSDKKPWMGWNLISNLLQHL